MPTLLIDLDLDALPEEPIQLPGPQRVRAVVWRGLAPLGQIAFDAGHEVTPERLEIEARLQLGDSTPPSKVTRPASGLPTMTVAICTRDRPADLLRCLDSLRLQVDPPTHEVLVVDNAPATDATRNLVHARGDARYVVEDVPGLDFARNGALREASGEILVFLDDDTIAPPGWLRSVAAVFAREPHVGVSSGPVIPAELETEAQELFERRGGFTQTFEPQLLRRDTPGQAGHWPLLAGAHASGCNLAVRTAAMRSLGGFDEALGAGTPAAGGDDYDIVYRMLMEGYTFAYEPDTLLKHRHRRDMDALTHQMESWGRGTVAYLMKCKKSRESRRLEVWRAIAWLFKYEARRLAVSARPSTTDRFPVTLVLAELGGCVRGLWAYRRSQRYVRRVTSRPSSTTR